MRGNNKVDFEVTNSPQKKRKKISLILDVIVQGLQLALFLVTFSLITHNIVNLEFEVQGRKSLQDFVMPAIISVFTWMMSLSYMLLALVLDDSQPTEQALVFTRSKPRLCQRSFKAITQTEIKYHGQIIYQKSNPSSQKDPEQSAITGETYYHNFYHRIEAYKIGLKTFKKILCSFFIFSPL